MKPILSKELLAFFAMVGLGGLIGVIFDLLRAFRKIIKRDFFVHITDIVFWVSAFFVTVITLYLFLDGELRFFLVISAFSGVFL